MTVTFNTSPENLHYFGNTLHKSKSGTISGGSKYINETVDMNFKSGKTKKITSVLRKNGKDFSDIYSNIYRTHTKEGSSLKVIEKLSKNGNATKTYALGGVRRLKISHKAGRLAGVTLYNSKGLKFGFSLPKLLKAVF